MHAPHDDDEKLHLSHTNMRELCAIQCLWPEHTLDVLVSDFITVCAMNNNV